MNALQRGSAHLKRMGSTFAPHFFQIVKRPHLGFEYVYDYITRINQHPVAMRHALDPASAIALLLERTQQMIGDGRDMTVRTPTRNHHVIGEGGFSGQIYGNNLLGFVIIKASENQIKQFTMGSDVSSALLAGFRGRYMRGQGKFSIFIAMFSLSRTSSFNCSIRYSALVASWFVSP